MVENSKFSHKELFIFLILIPLLLIGVFCLPRDIRSNYFTLHTNSFNITEFLLFNLNHASWDHLIHNLTTYLLVLIPIIFLETNKPRFKWFIFAIFTIVPVFLALVTIIFTPNIPEQVGFSGAVAALIGYVVIVTYDFVKKSFSVEISPNLILLILLINLVVASLTLLEVWTTVLLILIIIYYLYQERNSLQNIWKKLIDIRNKKEQYTLATKAKWIIVCSFALIFVFFAITLLIPNTINTGGVIVAIHSHYLGYLMGILPLYTNEVFCTRKKSKSTI